MTAVLVIEDDRSIMRFIELNLRAEGYDVRSAFDANEGLKLLAEAIPDLVILDLGLPSLSGWETLSILQRNPAWDAIPVAILTAKAAPEEERRAREFGVADYLVKPLGATDFLNRIAALVQKLGDPRNGFARDR